MNKHYIKQILTIVLLSLLSLSASAREVVIPEGTKVVTSGDGYRGDTTITSIVIPDSVTEIGWYAFEGCTGLTSVEIPNSVTQIGEYAFSGCTGLTSVEIPNSVTQIDSAAFSHCISLTSVEIPNSVMYLSGFSDCTGLTSIVIPNSVTEIGGAFTGCTSLMSVEIPNSVTEIGWHAFSGCTGLTSVVIPNSVTEIGAGAFKGCTGLTSVEIPNSVTEIGWYAFSGCTALTSVEIPNSVTLIYYEAFYGCTNLSRVVCYAVEPPAYYSSYYYHVFSDETLKGTLYVPAKSIDAYKSSKLWGQFKTILPIEETEFPTVTIDETIRVCEHDLPIMWRGHEIYGDTVLSFNDTLRYMNLSVQRPVVIEMFDTVFCGASYKDYGFAIKDPVSGVYTDTLSTAEGCDSVVVLHLEVNGELVIPEGTKEITYEDGYHGNKCITSVKIPNSVTEIGRFAFEDCSGLTSVEIPSSVTSIGEYAFSGCSGLTSIEVDPKNTSYASQGGTLYNKEMTALICVPARVKGSFEIPNSVTSIGQYAFDGCSGLTSVVIPNSVTKIGEYAFADCEGLTSVVIPSSVTNMGEYTFYGCRFSSVTCYAIEPPSQYHAFGKGGGVDTFFVPAQSVEAYKKDKEWYYTSATIILPISDDAPVSITQTLTICDNELPIKWNGHWVKGDTTLALGADTVVDLRLYVNHSMETILYDTVLCGSSYQDWGWSMKDPQSDTYVDTFTTATGCDSIVTLHLYVMGGELVIPEGTETISYKDGYQGNKCITSVVIPSSVTSIGGSAFAGCTGLTSVEIPSSVTSIEYRAFSGCSGLTSVEIPSSVTSIGRSAFSGCSGLTSVEIPNSVTEIVWLAFEGCSGLTSIKIPSSVTEIGKGAFIDCENLSKVICYAVTPPSAHADFCEHGTLYVPAQSVEAYKNDRSWGQFDTILPISDDAPVSITQTLTICDNELPIKWNGHWVKGDTTLALGADTVVDLRLYVNHSMETILYDTVLCGSSYQDWGWSMKEPQSGTYVDTFTTATGCDSIVTLHLYVMGDELVIPEGTKEITYEDGYHGNKCITSVKIPNSVTEIGWYAFSGCTSLTSVVIPNSVTKIDSFVFVGCTGLTSVKIPNSVEYVERGAFAGCVGLTSVELPNSVMMIGQEAFSHCISLTSVEIPNSVTEIGWYAFSGCTGLTSVEIPNSVTEIGTYAFSGCTSLSKVVCYAVEPPAYYSSYYYHVFSEETLSNILYVPSQSINSYKTDKYWGRFKTILPIEGSELPTVTIDEIIPVCENDLPINWRNHWIDGDTILTISSKSGVDTLFHISLEIHSTFGVTDTLRLEQGERYEWFHWVITEAGLYTDTALTAMGCDSIVSLYVYYKEPTDTIPTEEVDTLYYQGTMAEWCANPVVSASLKAVVIEGQIYEKNTKSLVLPEGVATIHGKAFALCPNIRTLVLPSTLVAISDSAFKSCISLASVTCYAPEPPVAMASTFGNYNGYLYIPCDYQSDYDIHVCWGTFKHVDCIAAESTVVEDVEVDPSYDSADISWPKVEDVKGYSIEIYLNGKVLLSLRFNANGQLERIDFSLGNGSVNPAPASMGSLTTLKSAIEGFRFSVSGLEEATTYRYTLKVLGDMDKVIETHSGKFTTLEKPSDGVEDIDSSKDDFIVFAQNGLISVVSEEAAPVLIYNLQGQCLFSHQGSCTFRAPCAGVYVVRCGERTVKLIMNYEF